MSQTEADEIDVPEEWECRYIPRDRWLTYLADGWEVKEMGRNHGEYSVLATRKVGADQPE